MFCCGCSFCVEYDGGVVHGCGLLLLERPYIVFQSVCVVYVIQMWVYSVPSIFLFVCVYMSDIISAFRVGSELFAVVFLLES